MSDKEVVVQIPASLEKFKDNFQTAIMEELTFLFLQENVRTADYKIKVEIKNPPTPTNTGKQ